MTTDWPETSLGDECDLLTGFPFKSAQYTDDSTGVRLVRGDNVVQGRLRWDGVKRWPSDATSDLEQYQLQQNDVVLAMDRPWIEAGLKYAAISTHDLPALLVQRVSRIRGGSKLDTRFLKYLIGSAEFTNHVLSVQTGTAVPHISAGQIKSFTFRRPPVATQRRIAEILGTLDDKIELNRRMNQTLEAMARRLFKSWFVDFDPVRRNAAKLEGKSKKSKTSAPSHFSLRTSEFDHLFPDSFEDSTLGQIPKGWTAGTVPDAIEINPTRSLSKGTVAPWLEMSNMPTRSARALAWEYRAVGSGTKFINGDTLVARITPCLENGKTAFVDFLSEGEVGAGSTEYIVLRAKPPLPPVFAYLLARTDDFRQHLITNMTGTSGRQRAPANCLNSYPLVTPSERIAELFGEATESLFVHMKTNDEASLAVRVTRDKLLPKLLSGELTTTNDFLKDSQ